MVVIPGGLHLKGLPGEVGAGRGFGVQDSGRVQGQTGLHGQV